MSDPAIPRRFELAVDPVDMPAGLRGAITAIGNFDGLHRGHKAVLQRAKGIASALRRPAVVLTFEPHPSDYFGGPATIFRLTPMAAKARYVEELGMDGMVVLPFDASLAGMAAEDFVQEVLLRRLQVGAVVVGYDFHFGKKRAGTPAFLRAAGERYGFEVDLIGKIAADDEGGLESVSSTAIRAALQQGDVATAGKLLGHPYMISGMVRSGQRLGRTLGFPTANVEADPSCRLRHGIYAVRVEVEGATRAGVASWGRRPTVDNGAPLLEVYLFDFAEDFYGKTIDVSFVAWLRGEEKFASLDEMKRQMLADVEDAHAALAAS